MATNTPVDAKIKADSKSAEQSIDSLIKVTDKLAESVDKVGQKIDKVSEKREKTTKKSGILNKATLSMTISALGKIQGILDSTSNLTSKYTTSVRLLNTTLGESSKQANNYVRQLSEMSGIDETTLNRQVAIFGQLGQSLNLGNQYAEKFSENLTTLATKMSILYNSDFNTMATALQRAVQGTQTTLRSKTGIQVTDESMQMLLAEKEIEAQVKDLNDAEKALVKYAVILNKVTNQMDVYGEAVNSVAWQKQMFTMQITRLYTALNNMLYPILQRILPVLNGILMVITEIINIIAKLIGFSGETSNIVSTTADSFDNLGASIAGASSKAKKSLRGFDKLNNIITPSGSGGGLGGILGVNSGILGILDSVNDNFLKIRNRATEIRDAIMGWLGFIKIVNDDTGEITWKLRDGYTNIEKIRDIVGAIILTIAGAKIVQFIGNIVKALGVLKSGEALGGVAGGLQAIGGLVLSAFGVESAGVVATFGTGIAVVAGAVAGVYGAIKLYQWAVSDAIGETDKLAGVSDKTVQRLQPVEDAFDNLRRVINSVDYTGIALKEEDKQAVLEAIDKLTEEMKIALDKYVDEQIASLNYLYYTQGFITEEQYKEELKKLGRYKEDELKKIDEKNAELLRLYENLFDEEGRFSMENYGKLLNYLNEYNSDVLKSLTLSAEDKKKIQEAEAETDKEIKKKSYSELLKNFKERENAVKENAKAEYDETLRRAENIFGIESEQYRQIKELADKKYKEQTETAERFYEDQYKAFVKSNTDIAQYIEKDTGNVKSNWSVFWEKNKNIAEIAGKSMEDTFLSVSRSWNALKFATKTIKYVVEGVQNFIGGKTESFATGGFPDEEDGLFYANHNEMVGKFTNGKTAVANNNQIVEGIQQGVFSAMMSALSTQDFGSKVVIEATGDDAGLMNFINFKQRQLDRQFN